MQQFHEQSDSEVVQQIRSGDNGAFDELMRRYKRPVVNFVYRMLGSAEDADDIAQEVFVRVYQNLDTYRPETKFSTWLFALTRNAAIDRLRWRARHPTEPIESTPQLATPSDTAGDLFANLSRAHIAGGGGEVAGRSAYRPDPRRVSRSFLCRDCRSDALLRNVGRVPSLPGEADAAQFAAAPDGVNQVGCRALITLIDSPQHRQRISQSQYFQTLCRRSGYMIFTKPLQLWHADC